VSLDAVDKVHSAPVLVARYDGLLRGLAIKPVANFFDCLHIARLSESNDSISNAAESQAVPILNRERQSVTPRLLLWPAPRIAGLTFLERHCFESVSCCEEIVSVPRNVHRHTMEIVPKVRTILSPEWDAVDLELDA
jgi:hypothetical protein